MKPIDIAKPLIVPGARFHDSLAASWGAAYQSGSFNRRLLFFLPYLDRLVVPGSSWLDAGCGSGVLARQLSMRGARVIAMDASAAMIVEGCAANHDHPTIEFRQIQTIESLPLPAGSVDGVLCSSVLEYVDDVDSALREFVRVLAPGAVVLLTVPNRFSLIRRVQSLIRACGRVVGRSWFPYLDVSNHAFTTRQISRLLEKSGFVVDEVAGFSPFLPHVLVPLQMGALWLVVGRRAIE